MNERREALPLSYRVDLLARLMPALQAGECCVLVGTSGVGKSNLLQFLRRPDVQSHYWSGDHAWVIWVDTHNLVFGEQSTEFVITELMIHQLIREAEKLGLTDVASWASDLHARLVAQPSSLLAWRYLERICARLCEMLNLHLTFAFDQFENIWRMADARFFLNLRHLRD